MSSEEKLSLKVLNEKIQGLDATDLKERIEVLEEQIIDLVGCVIESLVRTRSSGAFQAAEALRDKYLDPERDLSSFGEEFVSTSTLRGATKGN